MESWYGDGFLMFLSGLLLAFCALQVSDGEFLCIAFLWVKLCFCLPVLCKFVCADEFVCVWLLYLSPSFIGLGFFQEGNNFHGLAGK